MALDKIMQWKGEQLFLFEVFINRLDVHPDNVANLTSANDLLMQIKVIDLAPFEINTNNCPNTKQQNTFSEKGDFKFTGNSILVNAGKSCLFSKLPISLVNIMRSLPLVIEIYKVPVEEPNCLPQYNRTLLFSTKVPLPGCLCHQANLARVDPDELPAPFTAKNVYNLYDPRGKHSACISIFLRLSCIGRSIMTDFTLHEGDFVFQDSSLGEKFQCHKMNNENIQKVNEAIKNDIESMRMQEKKCENVSPRLLVLATTASKLPILKQNPMDAYGILKRPESPPRVSMKEPGFRALTSAEKLNDREYRNHIYRTYPNEPTCPCLPKFQFTNPMVCASGCNRPCCMKLRNPKILSERFIANGDKKTLLSTYCTNKVHPRFTRTKNTASSCCNVMRLRGGGSVEEIYKSRNDGYFNYNTKSSQTVRQTLKMQRLFAGGEGNTSCICSGSIPVPSETDQDVTQSSCRPRSRSLNAAQASCVCAGKQTQLFGKGNATCSKKPCMGVDCLIRAFHEAQDFVDSLGKVPGLEGLGLMNPSESPFFGRDMSKNYQEYSLETAAEQQRMPALNEMANRNCTARCNTLLGKPPDFQGGSGLIPYSSATPLSVALPRNTGVVREAIPTLPRAGTIISSMRPKTREDAKLEKTKDDIGSSPLDVELGPCGEPTCRSRLKKSLYTAYPESKKETDGEVVDSKGKGILIRKDTQRGKGRSNRLNDAYINERKGRKGRFRNRGNMKEDGSKEYGERGTKVTLGLPWPGPDGDRVQSSIKISPQVKRYVHTIGNYYPGINFGHRDCMAVRMRVPKNMGWLWNTRDVVGNVMPGIGWKPGAIYRDAYTVLKEAKAISLENMEYEEESSTRIRASKSRSQTSESAKTRRGGTRGGIRQAGGGEEIRQEISTSQTRLKGGATIRQAGGGTRSYKEETDRQGALKSLRPVDSRTKLTSNPRGKKGKTQITGSAGSMKRSLKTKGEPDEEERELPPTLHIHRKDGVYYVTMYPIRQETSDEPQLEEPMKPLQFKIIKDKDEDSDSSSSTASDMEIEFSPPAAVNRIRKKPNVVHVSTQVRHREILEALESSGGHKRDKKGSKKKKGTRK